MELSGEKVDAKVQRVAGILGSIESPLDRAIVLRDAFLLYAKEHKMPELIETIKEMNEEIEMIKRGL